MKQLHLIRHGCTRANAEMVYCGSTDLPLSPEGRKVLETERHVLRYPELGGNCAIYTSGMRRTEETLSILYGNVPHQVLLGMREIDFGEFEMHAYDELKHWDSYQKWISGNCEQNCCPNGESGQQMQERVLKALDELLKTKGNALVVTHGGVIAIIMAHLFPQIARSRFAWQPPPGKGYTIVFCDRQAVSFEEIPYIIADDC